MKTIKIIVSAVVDSVRYRMIHDEINYRVQICENRRWVDMYDDWGNEYLGSPSIADAIEVMRDAMYRSLEFATEDLFIAEEMKRIMTPSQKKKKKK